MEAGQGILLELEDFLRILWGLGFLEKGGPDFSKKKDLSETKKGTV